MQKHAEKKGHVKDQLLPKRKKKVPSLQLKLELDTTLPKLIDSAMQTLKNYCTVHRWTAWTRVYIRKTFHLKLNLVRILYKQRSPQDSIIPPMTTYLTFPTRLLHAVH